MNLQQYVAVNTVVEEEIGVEVDDKCNLLGVSVENAPRNVVPVAP